MALKLLLLNIFPILTVCVHTFTIGFGIPIKTLKNKHLSKFGLVAMWATWALIWIRPLGNLVANGEWVTVNFKPCTERTC